jgi:hypothetical protein
LKRATNRHCACSSPRSAGSKNAASVAASSAAGSVRPAGEKKKSGDRTSLEAAVPR